MKLLALLLVVLLSQALAQQVPTKPFLRIEAQMHTATIWGIAVDSSQTYLIKGSDDKTVRVWELKTGNLAKALRVPIDEGSEGRVYTVALSPDGKHLAVGGWTGHWDGKTFAIYIFDLKTGKIIKSIS
ncbi:MAG: hypothetical protein NZ526_01425 [Aquificaceae bacterium]|nr:hypothetical protein [Aquificaceae bacterium]